MRVPGLDFPGDKVRPVEGAQSHTKLNVEFGGGEGRDAGTEEWEREGAEGGQFSWLLSFAFGGSALGS